MVVSEEFVLHDGGDSSVGIDGFTERVQIIFHDRQFSLDGEELLSLSDTLAEWADCGCVSAADYRKQQQADARATDYEYRVWLREQVRSHFGDDGRSKLFLARYLPADLG